MVLTICGRKNLAMGMVTLKSVLIFTTQPIHFVIMTEADLVESITATVSVAHCAIVWLICFVPTQLKEYRKHKSNFVFEFHMVGFPESEVPWRKLFKNCASQRLFLPAMLPHVDALLYIDTDVLFLAPVEQLWSSTFGRMNSTQLLGMSNEGEDAATNWYHRFAAHPYYGRYGLNSGVMFMNLTRMRRFGWNARIEPAYRTHRDAIVWGDQDIINIIVHDHPDRLLPTPCTYNFRPDHCIYSPTCALLKQPNETIKLLHGNRDSFFNHKCPEFKAVFQTFEEFELGRHHPRDLTQMLTDKLTNLADRSKCYLIASVFVDAVRTRS